MRLHSLTITAFGPFAGTEQVDFDTLAASGLFLLRGATGAGKTSVLDAVCFALYGSVPGDRRPTRLRSDHADPHLPTEVVLDVTLGGRRLEITRRPEQPRPKKRGGGVTTEKAQTLLREWNGTGWTAASKSHQEVGEEIARLLGMSRDQFCQVVLLPQGDFARFLRADATQRADLLGRLFDTRRFGQVEEWLADRRRAGEERLHAAQDGLRQLIARLDQEAGDHAEPPPEATDHALGWAAVLRCDADEQHTIARSALQLAEQDHLERQHQSTRILHLAEHQRRHRDAQQRARDLAAAAPDRDADRRRLTAARSAAVVESALRLHRTAADAYTAAEQHERAARAALGPDRDASVQELATAEAQARADIVRLEAARQDERRHTKVSAELHRLEAESRAAEELRQEAERRLADLPREEDRLRERLTAAQEGAALAEQATAHRHEAERRLTAAQTRDDLLTRTRLAETDEAALHHLAAQARTAWLDLREQRLDGMAAELAERLRDGDPCPVCGSAAHPSPTRPSPTRVTREDEQAAQTAFHDADAAAQRATDTVRALREQAAAATAIAGDTPVSALTADLTALASTLTAALHAADDLVPAEQALTRLAAEREQYLAQQQLATTRQAAHTALLDTLLPEQQALTDRLDRARGDAPSVAERTTRLTHHADRLSTAVTAARETADAAARLKDADAEVAASTVAAGFATPSDAASALLPPAELDALQTRLERWDSEQAAVDDLLRNPDLLSAAAHPPADPTSAQTALEAATTRLRTAAATEAAARRRRTELHRLGTELTTRATTLAPALAEQTRISRLSQLASGTSSDNRLRMRLESYVLAARLEQVAAAASSRLVRMSGGRYTLVHSDGKAAGTRRSGLSLRVVDAWTGTERDTATLSGGESFFASLALALGLADVVTDEAGGMPLDTLFIDEGFGTLDEHALEEVLDVLDGLRERDRAVGIVSHVADLRHRIPAQLLVHKGRHGSTLHPTSPEAP